MSRRLHAASWVIVAAIAILVGGTRFDPRAEGEWRTRVETSALFEPDVMLPATRRGHAASGGGVESGLHATWAAMQAPGNDVLERWVANLSRAWRALQRLGALIAAWVPVILAGACDGLAGRRARRCGLAPASEFAGGLARHALIAFAALPFAWACLGGRMLPLAVAVWSVATSLALSRAIAEVDGAGSRD